MAASLHELCGFVLCGLLAAGCAKGSGEGSAVGQVWAPDCGLDGAAFSLNPDYFAMQPSTSVEIIDIVVQRGSDLPSYSDGLAVFIVAGTIRFDELYVPWLDNATKETLAVFTNVELVDNKDPLERRAVLDGDFSFLFEVGRPLQYF